MPTILKKLSIQRTQRLTNGIISLVLFVWILSIQEHVYYSSGMREHYKFDVLLFMFGLYITQTILNKKWLNIILLTTYFFLLFYVFYSYVYAFFDENDNIINKQYGIVIKTWGTFLKCATLVTAIWITKRTRPN